MRTRCRHFTKVSLEKETPKTKGGRNMEILEKKKQQSQSCLTAAPSADMLSPAVPKQHKNNQAHSRRNDEAVSFLPSHPTNQLFQTYTAHSTASIPSPHLYHPNTPLSRPISRPPHSYHLLSTTDFRIHHRTP